MMHDLNGNMTNLYFDFTEDPSSFIVGLNIQRYSQRLFLQPKTLISLKNPQKRVAKQLPIYINEYSPFLFRAHVDIIEDVPTSKLFCAAIRIEKLRQITLVKRIYRYSHAPTHEMIKIMKSEGKGGYNIKRACKEIAG